MRKGEEKRAAVVAGGDDNLFLEVVHLYKKKVDEPEKIAGLLAKMDPEPIFEYFDFSTGLKASSKGLYNISDERSYTKLMCLSKYPGNHDCIRAADEGVLGQIDAQLDDGVTALSLAAINGCYLNIQALTEKRASLELADENGVTPLMYAVENGGGCTHALLKAGANPNARDSLGQGVMHRALGLAVEAADPIKKRTIIESLKLLLMHPDIDVNARSQKIDEPDQAGEWTVLCFAAQEGSTEIVKILSKKPGIELNSVIRGGGTPLLLAAQAGHTECVKILLEAGADFEISNAHGFNALMLAALSNHQACVELLIPYFIGKFDAAANEGDNALILAAEHGSVVPIRLLIDAGADVNAINRFREAPLMLVARLGLDSSAGFLLDKGANIDSSCNSQFTALMCAAEKGHTQCVKLLIERGADVQLKNEDGKTAFDLAHDEGHTECTKVLLEKLLEHRRVGMSM